MQYSYFDFIKNNILFIELSLDDAVSFYEMKRLNNCETLDN